MKIKKLILAALAVLICLSLCACKNNEEEYWEENPEEFSYDMLDLSIVVDEIYKTLEISELTLKSVEKVTDKLVLTEQYYLDLKGVISYDIRSAEGKYGVADVAVIRVKEGYADSVLESLDKRKDDRTNEFLNYDVYDSYAIAMGAEVYEAGELVIMLMIPEDNISSAKEIIDYYLP